MYIGNERVTNGEFREAAHRAFYHPELDGVVQVKLREYVSRIVLMGDAALARDLAILFGRLWEVTAPNPAPIRLAAAPTGRDDDSLEDDVAEDLDGVADTPKPPGAARHSATEVTEGIADSLPQERA
jgi:hypothetical protein